MTARLPLSLLSARRLSDAFADPRHFQIAALGSLLLFGVATKAFSLTAYQALGVAVSACAVQALGSYLIATKPDIRSALITALSLSLLLRANDAWPLMVAAAIAIGSKFMLRLNGKHIFNPANFAIVATTLGGTAVWTTPGQWGAAIWFALLLAGIGMIVTYRAARLDVPLIFLGVFAAILLARALWLGDPLSIPLLRLQNGALILFAFFMISDPKTTPDGAIARALFAAGAAMLSYFMIWHMQLTDGIFYALFVMCLARPLLEWADPAPHYRWGDPAPRLTWPSLLRPHRPPAANDNRSTRIFPAE